MSIDCETVNFRSSACDYSHGSSPKGLCAADRFSFDYGTGIVRLIVLDVRLKQSSERI
jgi:hypothetical protein